MDKQLKNHCLCLTAHIEFFKDHMKRLDKLIPLDVQDAMKVVDMYVEGLIEENKGDG